ncbi:MAG TPA: RNA methyltransferase [Vicinamibacterales bacterium]|nr:RNA methyltransferase [Vicinamibacterales bacterium]
MTRIADADDPRIQAFRNVPDPELLRTYGLFVAEGRLVVRRLLGSTQLITRAVLVTEPALRSIEDALAPRADVPVYVVPQEIMNGLIGFNIHRGCLALGERPEPRRWRELASAARRLVVLERVANADNIGSIFRNAAAFGADAVLLGPSCTDPLYRKAIRTSIGASLVVPFATAEPWPEALAELRRDGWLVVATTPAPDALPLRDLLQDGDPGGRVAIVLGHEGEGLTRDALGAASVHARIPMAPGADSLNVAAAGAIALYELFTSHR